MTCKCGNLLTVEDRGDRCRQCVLGAPPKTPAVCGSFGCNLPLGHNMGKADVPANHSVPTLAGISVRVSDFVPDDTYILVSKGGKMTLGKLIDSHEMSLNEYQRQSVRTAEDVGSIYLLEPGALFQLSGFGLGVAGEAGEVADIIKKFVHHEHEIDREAMKKELGDVLWYVQAIADRYGLTLEEVARANVEKLQKRYPNGWNAADSVKRVDLS